MCGIAGIVRCEGLDADAVALATRMRDVIAHRGPDESGLHADAFAVLAHRRLSIVDLSTGQQPLANEDGSVWVVFNGEIYNHAEIRERLERAGHRYRTRSDTETILHLYEEVGDRVVHGLRGMFAFALWDRRRRRLLMARDRLGIKPLYVAIGNREIVFASEIKGIFASGLRPSVNADVLPEFLATRFVSGDQTFFQGIRRLEPGCTLTWSEADGVDIQSYWRLPDAPAEAPRPLGLEVENLRRRLELAVERHLMSDVPLGVFLSGGVDSTALAGLTARASGTRLQTFAVGCGDVDSDDLPYARLAADRIGSHHRELLVTPDQFFAALPRLIWHEDEPIAFTSSVPLYFVSQLASDHVKVVLTGEGADELFLGYNRYRVTLWNSRFGRPYWAVMPEAARAAVRRGLRTLPPSARRYVDRTFLALEPGIRDFYFENFAVFPGPLRQALLSRATRATTPDPYATTVRAFDAVPGDLRARMMRADLPTYLHELLMKQDQMSMAASIESRVPFLDDDLVAYVSGLPSRYKLRGWKTKAILRAAVRDVVPPEILDRRKMGFPVPMGQWLRRPEWTALVDECLLGDRASARGWFDRDAIRRLVDDHRTGRRDHGDRLWLLLNFEIWQRVVCEGEPATDIWPRRRRAGTDDAYPLGQNGRFVAAQYGRPPAQLPHSPGAGASA